MGDWVTIGVVGTKYMPKKTKTGKNQTTWGVYDLLGYTINDSSNDKGEGEGQESEGR